MEYKKYFDIEKDEPQRAVPWPEVREQPADGADAEEEDEGPAVRTGDRRDGLVYVYNEKIELAVNVALATGRPMLVRGPSGGGKSSLARNVARRLKWRYYERVITSRTQAHDLLWTFDALRRLSDAQAQRLEEEAAHYVEPGVLWWAFDPSSAARRGLPEGQSPKSPAEDPGVGPKESGAVVLLDEIDKADPDVPNNLLVPLGSFEFRVRETNTAVAARRPLLVLITTNDERVLPAAFMRRCVVLKLDAPLVDDLVGIAQEHYGPDLLGIYRPVAERVVALAPGGGGKAAPRKEDAAPGGPSTAEYLDTVRAFSDLGLDPLKKEEWQLVSEATLSKQQTPA